jgi:hypothetical protein
LKLECYETSWLLNSEPTATGPKGPSPEAPG